MNLSKKSSGNSPKANLCNGYFLHLGAGVTVSEGEGGTDNVVALPWVRGRGN